MSESGLIDLNDKMEGVIWYCRKEYDMSNAELIGALEIIKLNLYHQIAASPEDTDADADEIFEDNPTT